MKKMVKIWLALLLILLVGLTGCADGTVTPAPPLIKTVADLPLPSQLLRLDFGLEELKKVLGPSNLPTDPTGLEVGVYASSQPAADLLKFYQTELKQRGWTFDDSRSNPNLLYFAKDNRLSSVLVLGVPSQAAIENLAQLLPSSKGKFKPGDSLLVLSQGPSKVFE